MSINTENTTENAVDNPENREKEDREGFELITEWNQLGALRSKLVQLYIGPEKRYYLGYLDNIRPKGRIADLYLRDCFHPTVNPVEGMRYYYKSKELGNLQSIRMIRGIELGEVEYKIME